MTREQLISECRCLSESDESMEAVVRYLRASACSKIDSIAMLVATYGIGVARAKEVVHLSPSWDDTRASDETFHDRLVDAVTKGEE